jgi:hypothetical protein
MVKYKVVFRGGGAQEFVLADEKLFNEFKESGSLRDDRKIWFVELDNGKRFAIDICQVVGMEVLPQREAKLH